MENKKNFGFGTQIRKYPYFKSAVAEKLFYDPKKRLANS